MVHRTGNESIDGIKTFNNVIYGKDSIALYGGITLGSSSSTWGRMLQFRDTEGKRIGRVQVSAISTTINTIGMWVNNADNTQENGIFIQSDGSTKAPTPATTDNSNKIATTSWVNSRITARLPQIIYW